MRIYDCELVTRDTSSNLSLAMGYFDETLSPEPLRQSVSTAMQRQIGAFFVAWATLESEIDITFPVLFRLDPNLAACITSNLGTKAKIDILSSGIDTQSEMLGRRQVDSAHKILEKIRTLNDRARNTLAHGFHFKWEDDATGKKFNAVLRYVARKRMTIIAHPGNVKYWVRMTKAAEAAAKSLRRDTRRIHEMLKQFPDDHWERTGLTSRIAEPVVLRRRNRPPPKKDGSRGHRPKHGKP